MQMIDIIYTLVAFQGTFRGPQQTGRYKVV